MQHGPWYAKVALFSASAGAAMEFFMIRTGFYEKVDLEAQRRAEELQAAKVQLDASAMLQQQQPNFVSREGTATPVGPS